MARQVDTLGVIVAATHRGAVSSQGKDLRERVGAQAKETGEQISHQAQPTCISARICSPERRSVMWDKTLIVFALLLGTVAARAQDLGVSVTAGHQILVVLRPSDTEPASRFDLDGRTVVFTPDGHGRYSRQVTSLAWESDIGATVRDGHKVQLQSFMFDFAGQQWGSFFVSRRGLITFGGPFTYIPRRGTCPS